MVFCSSGKAMGRTKKQIDKICAGRVKFYMNGSPHVMCLLQSPYQTEEVGRLIPDSHKQTANTVRRILLQSRLGYRFRCGCRPLPGRLAVPSTFPP